MTRPLRIFIAHPSHFLTDCEPHGDGLVAHGLLRRLAERGHELHIAAGLTRLREPMPANVHLHPVPTRIPHRRDRQPLLYRLEYAVRVRLLFARLHRQQPFDLIHQMNPVVGGLSLLLAGLGCPLVMGPLWPLWDDPKRRAGSAPSLMARLKHLVLAAQFLRADGVLVPTPAGAARLPRSLREAGRAYPFPIGIDADAFAPAAPPSPAAADPREPGADPVASTVLFLANLQERKGIFVLLEAFDRVAAHRPAARLLIGGAGWDEAEVRRRIAELPSAGRIAMLGNIAREQVPATLARAGVYCLPSFGEPYGMSALEAMAAGRALVVTDAGGLGHLVPDGGSRKVRPQDAAALAEALDTLLGDARLQRQLGAYNRAHVEAHHSWPRVIDRLEAVYTAVLPQPARTAVRAAQEAAL